MDSTVSAYVQQLQAMTEAKLAEELYSCRQDLQNIPKCSWVSENTKLAFEWTKEKTPYIEAEVARRGMKLPHWV